MKNQPDPNLKAPRPAKHSPEQDGRPDMDHPPKASRRDRAAFDAATAVADEAARNGGLTREGNPTPPDTGRADAGRAGGRRPPGGST